MIKYVLEAMKGQVFKWTAEVSDDAITGATFLVPLETLSKHKPEVVEARMRVLLDAMMATLNEEFEV